MPKKENKLVIQQVITEQNQNHETRKDIYVKLEKQLGRPIVSFFTSFMFPVMIEDADVDMLEGILQKLDLSKGLALVINSPGGDALAAERMINVCRTYSGTRDYWAIVPGKAKSAATMICFGASKIIMGEASELGAVDPQVTMVEGDEVKRFSVYNVIKSYNKLFMEAVKAKGNLQPYLQQLANYDARQIEEWKAAEELSRDIAIETLKSGMMSRYSKREIQKKIQIFLTPKKVKAHGRPIYGNKARSCGLNVKVEDVKQSFWQILYELYIRMDNFVSTRVPKCIESREHSFVASIRGITQGEE